MKKSRFFLVLFVSFSLCLVTGVFFAGYLLIQHYFAIPPEIEEYVRVTREERKAQASVQTTSQTPELVSEHLTNNRVDVFVLLDEEDRISYIAAGQMNAVAGKAKLVTFPLDSRISLSESVYCALTAKYPTMPQYFQLGVLADYVEPSELGEVAGTLLTAVASCEVDGVWTISMDFMDRWLTEEDGVLGLSEYAERWLREESSKKQVLSHLQSFTERRLDAQGEENARRLQAYAEVLDAMRPENITYERAAGNRKNEGYDLDAEQLARQLLGI